MDLASYIGLAFGLVALVFGMADGGVGAGDVFHVPAMLIVFGGSLGILVMGNPMKQTIDALKATGRIFKIVNFNEEEKILQIISFAEKARRDGLLSLEDDMANLDDLFMKKALQLVIDGTDPEIVRNIMEIDLQTMEERHEKVRNIYEKWGVLAPACGMTGTLIGLVGMFKNLGGDLSSVGTGMAVAILTTLWGSVISNFYCNPVASKLKIQSELESTVKQIVIEGVLSLQAGDNPRVVQEKLANFLPPASRQKLQESQGQPNG